MNVIAVQPDVIWEDKQANFRNVLRLLGKTRPEKGSLVVLPEMFATGFSMDTGKVAEAYGGETEQFLARTAKDLEIYLVAGAAMRGRNGHARNKALVFSPSGELVAYYAKMRPFTLGGEPEHYLAGERPVVFPWGEFSVSPFICYDLRFPELFRQVAATHRPELFLVIANFPEKRIHHWVTLLQARAIENQAFVLGVNRVGKDLYYTYSGRSVIINPHGEILADAGARECCICASLDFANLRKYREGLPFLADLKTPL